MNFGQTSPRQTSRVVTSSSTLRTSGVSNLSSVQSASGSETRFQPTAKGPGSSRLAGLIPTFGLRMSTWRWQRRRIVKPTLPGAASVDAASKELLDAFYADAMDTHELKTEQLRLAAHRANAQAEIEKHEVSEHHLRERVENCLALLDNAHAHYLAADEISRKELNQAVFAYLYVADDEIVASDLKPAFQ